VDIGLQFYEKRAQVYFDLCNEISNKITTCTYKPVRQNNNQYSYRKCFLITGVWRWRKRKRKYRFHFWWTKNQGAHGLAGNRLGVGTARRLSEREERVVYDVSIPGIIALFVTFNNRWCYVMTKVLEHNVFFIHGLQKMPAVLCTVEIVIKCFSLVHNTTYWLLARFPQICTLSQDLMFVAIS